MVPWIKIVNTYSQQGFAEAVILCFLPGIQDHNQNKFHRDVYCPSTTCNKQINEQDRVEKRFCTKGSSSQSDRGLFCFTWGGGRSLAPHSIVLGSSPCLKPFCSQTGHATLAWCLGYCPAQVPSLLLEIGTRCHTDRAWALFMPKEQAVPSLGRLHPADWHLVTDGQSSLQGNPTLVTLRGDMTFHSWLSTWVRTIHACFIRNTATESNK